MKIKNKDRILKAIREKQVFLYKGTSLILLAAFLAETYRTERNGMINSNLLKENLTTKNFLCGKITTQFRFEEETEFCREVKTKNVQIIQLYKIKLLKRLF